MIDQLIPIQQYLFNYAYFLCKNVNDAEDLRQETNIKVIDNIDKFDGKYFKSWACTLMRNIFIDNKRKKNIDFEFYDNYITSESNHEIFDILDTIIIHERNEKLQKLLLLKVKGYKFREIAEILNENSVTLRVLFRNHRKRLKQQILCELQS